MVFLALALVNKSAKFGLKERKAILFLFLFLLRARYSPTIRVGLDTTSQPGYWPKLITGSATIACMRELRMHATVTM